MNLSCVAVEDVGVGVALEALAIMTTLEAEGAEIELVIVCLLGY